MQKKFTVLVSLLLMATMLLTACNGANNNNNNQYGAAGTAALGTPGAEGNGTPSSNGAAGSGQVTPAGGVPTLTPAVGMTSNITPTAQNGAGGTETPAVAIPETGGANLCQYNRVTKLVGMTVVDTGNKEIGTVKDVVVVRDTSIFNTSMGTTGNNASAQGQANGKGTAKGGNNASPQGKANGTGNAKNSSGGVIMPSHPTAAPMITYLVVDLNKDNGGKTVLLPFGALKFTAAAAENKTAEVTAAATVAATTASTQAASVVTSTPASTAAATSNGNTATPANACVVTLRMQTAALNNLPAFDASKVDFTAENWDQQYRSFFANQGFSIPVTGAGHQYGAAVMLGDNVSSVHVKNANNDDLGEVKDFIFNPANGQFSYAALGTGGFLGMGQKIVLIPMSALSWVSTAKNEQGDAGFLSINLTKEQIQAAPTVDNLDKVDFTASDWDRSLLNYWKNFGVTPEGVPTQGPPPSK